MATQEPADFGHLEPNGKPVNGSEEMDRSDEFEDGGDFLFDPVGEQMDIDSFSDQEADEHDDMQVHAPYLDMQTTGASRRTTADQTARVAMKWARHATTVPIFMKGAQMAGAPYRSQRVPEFPEKEYLDEYETGSDAETAQVDDLHQWSAGLAGHFASMENLAAAAAAARSKEEAGELMAASVPLAFQLVPHVHRALWPVLPVLIRAAVGVTRYLHNRRNTRKLLRHLPIVLADTVEQLSLDAADGPSITPQRAAEQFSRQLTYRLGGRGRRQSPRAGGRSRNSRSNRASNGIHGSEWLDDFYEI